jgi:hypothetical protein
MRKPPTKSINDNLNLLCDKCGGRVYSDREHLSDIHLELSCINCGKLWIFHHPVNHGQFVQWLHKIEMEWVEWKTNH